MPIFLEESLSFGVLGKTGRGATEHFDISVSYNELDPSAQSIPLPIKIKSSIIISFPLKFMLTNLMTEILYEHGSLLLTF